MRKAGLQVDPRQAGSDVRPNDAQCFACLHNAWRRFSLRRWNDDAHVLVHLEKSAAPPAVGWAASRHLSGEANGQGRRSFADFGAMAHCRSACTSLRGVESVNDSFGWYMTRLRQCGSGLTVVCR